MNKLQELERLLSSGKVTRREFITSVSAMGLTAALSPALLRATAIASEPKKGGRLRLGVPGANTTDLLEPDNINDTFLMVLNHSFRNCLVEVDHNGHLIPELAESWEAEPGAKKWFFKIRKGVEFHNGKTMDAEDVSFSINHHRGEKSKSAAKVLVETIAHIKSDGKQNVVFELKGGNADFPAYLSGFRLPIMPAGIDPNEGIGTGGYKIVKFEPGVRSFLKRYPNYWKEGRANFDEIEIIGINDTNARTNALKTGEVDAIARIDRKTAHLLEKSPRIQLLEVPGPIHYTYPMFTDVAPYDNNDVRMALKYAMDREAILKTVLGGHGYLGNDHPIARTMKYFASELPQRTYDPDKAKYHIKKAGLVGHKFQIHASDAAFTGAIDSCLLYSEHAKKAGMTIEVVRHPVDGFWGNVWSKKPWVTCYWLGRPTEDMMFTLEYAEDAAYNDMHWKHERFNKLLKEARSELNETIRREMYGEMQRIVRDEGGIIIPFFANQLDAASTKVKFESLAGNFELDGHRCAERWWFGS